MVFNSCLWAFGLVLSLLYLDKVTSQEADVSNDDGIDMVLAPVVGISTVENLTDVFQDFDSPLMTNENDEILSNVYIPIEDNLLYRDNARIKVSGQAILQIKLAIEYMHEKHEKLLSHIKCAIPKPPKNCSILPQPSKWNWTSLIPSGCNADSIFQNQLSLTEQRLKNITATFQAAIQLFEKKQNFIYNFITCACKVQSNCTAKPGWGSLLRPSYWLNQFQSHRPFVTNPFHWTTFGNRPKPNTTETEGSTGGGLFGSLGNRPILGIFNKFVGHKNLSSFSGIIQSYGGGSQNGGGFIVTLGGGHLPTLGVANCGPSGQQKPQVNNSCSGGSSSGLTGYFSGTIIKPTGTTITGTFSIGHLQQSSTSNATTSGQGGSCTTSGNTGTEENSNHTSSTQEEINTSNEADDSEIDITFTNRDSYSNGVNTSSSQEFQKFSSNFNESEKNVELKV